MVEEENPPSQEKTGHLRCTWGRRTNLSVARFTQEKGAKSSFEQVLGTLERVLGGRDVLVVDRRRKREMESVLREFAA